MTRAFPQNRKQASEIILVTVMRIWQVFFSDLQEGQFC